MRITTGSGDDQVELYGVTVNLGAKIDTGGGNDEVLVYSSSFHNTTDIFAQGSGVDAVMVESSNFLQSLKIRAHGGGDKLVAIGAGTVMGKDTSIQTGSGNDTVAILGLTTGYHFGLATYGGADTVDVTTQSTTNSKTSPDPTLATDLSNFVAAHVASLPPTSARLRTNLSRIRPAPRPRWRPN